MATIRQRLMRLEQDWQLDSAPLPSFDFSVLTDDELTALEDFLRRRIGRPGNTFAELLSSAELVTLDIIWQRLSGVLPAAAIN
jgi:hypothetical protein